MKALNYRTGKLGEQIGRKYLVDKGYQILQSNFQTRFGEIDLIATKNQKLVFFEVKLKVGDQFGSPEEMINKRKLAKIQNMAEYFLQSNPRVTYSYPSCQIDAICIVLGPDGEVIRINHWENLGNEMA